MESEPPGGRADNADSQRRAGSDRYVKARSTSSASRSTSFDRDNDGVGCECAAAWAGHSVEVLLKIYARCLDGGTEALRRKVEAAVGHRPAPKLGHISGTDGR